jgi:hypothetical protein
MHGLLRQILTGMYCGIKSLEMVITEIGSLNQQLLQMKVLLSPDRQVNIVLVIMTLFSLKWMYAEKLNGAGCFHHLIRIMVLTYIQLQDHSYVGLLKYYGEGPGYARISLVKMDPSGEPVWIQQQAQEDTLIYNEEGYHLIQTFDSNFLISGHCFYPGMRPFWIKTDTLGNQLWDLKGGGTGFADEVIQFNNDLFFSAGIKSGQNSFIPTIFKFDNSGTLLAQHFLLGDTLKGGGAKSIITFGNNDLLIGIGWRTSLNYNEGFSEILHCDTLGEIINRRILIDENRTPQSICLSSDQKIVVVGRFLFC